MGYWKVKPNMHGTGGGRWGTREEAKRFANKVRRRDDAAQARVPEEEEPDRGPRVGWLRLTRAERKALQADQFGDDAPCPEGETPPCSRRVSQH